MKEVKYPLQVMYTIKYSGNRQKTVKFVADLILPAALRPWG
jgi:hypothetical protein